MPRDRTQSSHENTSCFLQLPRELRDQIYVHLSQEHRQPPEDPLQAGERIANSSIHFEGRSPRPALLQFKLCSKQIYHEVSDILNALLKPEPDPAHLDIMVKDSRIYPTWLFLPLTRRLHPDIHVTLRLFES